MKQWYVIEIPGYMASPIGIQKQIEDAQLLGFELQFSDGKYLYLAKTPAEPYFSKKGKRNAKF